MKGVAEAHEAAAAKTQAAINAPIIAAAEEAAKKAAEIAKEKADLADLSARMEVATYEKNGTISCPQNKRRQI